LRKAHKEEKNTLWVPKAFCIASKYAFFDYFKAILEDLVGRLQTGKMLNLMEAYLFNIVFQIPVPIRNSEKVNFKLHKNDQPKHLTMS
jgi:hypothetical protein